MKNLGKIILILFLASKAIFANITASVDATSVELGEMVTYSIDISGEDIKRPNIQTLCNTDVISTNSQTSIQIVNQNYKKRYILSYKFLPQKSCEIPAIKVEVDGKIQTTNSVKISVVPADATKESDFVLSLQSDKKEVFVGEPFDLTLLLKQKKGAQAIDHEFIPPKLKGFWIKKESQPVIYDDEKYNITKIIYTMAPQRVGTLNITKAKIRIASRSGKRDSWGSWMPQIKWRTYFSNELNIEVKPLPQGVNLIGDFVIYANVDKNEVNPNEAVNVTIQVKGDGNLEDIASFKPYIDGVSVFDEKILIQGSILSQKMAFVGDSDFNIPPFSLKYYDLKTKKIKEISTKEIKIKVKNAKPQEKLTIKRDAALAPKEVVTVVQNDSLVLWSILAFVVGLVSGVLLMLFKPWTIYKKQKGVSIKDSKTLFIKLLPYKDDKQVQEILDILEKNNYSDANIKIDKKILKKLIEKYNIN